MLSRPFDRNSISSVMPQPCIGSCCRSSSTSISSVPLMTSPPRSSPISVLHLGAGCDAPSVLSRKRDGPSPASPIWRVPQRRVEDDQRDDEDDEKQSTRSESVQRLGVVV